MRKIYDVCYKIIVASAAFAVVSEWISIIGFVFMEFEDGVFIGTFGAIGMLCSIMAIIVAGVISDKIEKEMEEKEEN